ncbi:hypothetical protein KL935_000969 [Ogataea polymorpha]|uniref:Uncharacterized protein n=1 Tax=Ogataea polymorpha TaxID=460523 RepID=A0A1B7SL23_9ASCO|nr:uncharacterized protein OGAPODRAFT_15562 [Ogataea polymorpha]KAG7877901.1 hypothetical protein KL937_004414 [Ogataea polymorpha]KAG7896760.1 hypothetical protein KL908_000162 [Ogataea polymorpha]KAG7903437.1 hypothetical protein KL935_000969 [Ogataea polymorpha]KAG7911958.1 hypothetical protein KL906_000162 [Ogataea polymorpha]KAG7920277.1 hypothetical protein KL927_000957 [Ogataea polymorpha]
MIFRFIALAACVTSQKVLTDNVWTSTSSNNMVLVTPTVTDGVTISASPVSDSATIWNSLDSSGIPYLVTPSVSGSSTISASPTPTDTSYPSPTGGAPPVLRCMNERADESNSGYPFCIANGTEMLVGETYWITWDPQYWGSDDIVRVRLSTNAYPSVDGDESLFTSDYVINNNGYYAWEVKSSYRRSGTEGYCWLLITPQLDSTSNAKHTGTTYGPLIRIIEHESDAYTTITRKPSDNGATTTSSKSKAKIIVPAVVVPVVVLGFLIVGIVWYFRRLHGKTSLANLIPLKRREADAVSVTTDDLRSEVTDMRSEVTDYSRNTNPFH